MDEKTIKISLDAEGIYWLTRMQGTTIALSEMELGVGPVSAEVLEASSQGWDFGAVDIASLIEDAERLERGESTLRYETEEA